MVIWFESKNKAIKDFANELLELNNKIIKKDINDVMKYSYVIFYDSRLFSFVQTFDTS